MVNYLTAGLSLKKLYDDIYTVTREKVIMENTNYRLDNLYEAAIEQFARYGYKKTTVEDVAKFMGMTKGNIYFYVKNKNDLYIKSVSYALRKWMNFVSSGVSAENDPVKRLFLLARLSFEYVDRDEKLRMLLKNDPDIYTITTADDRFCEINDEAMLILRDVIEYGMERGIFINVNPDNLARFMYSVYIMFLIKKYTRPEKVPVVDIINDGLEVFIRGLVKDGSYCTE